MNPPVTELIFKVKKSKHTYELIEKYALPGEQTGSANPGGHAQSNALTRSVQLPLLKQGLKRHSSISEI